MCLEPICSVCLISVDFVKLANNVLGVKKKNHTNIVYLGSQEGGADIEVWWGWELVWI